VSMTFLKQLWIRPQRRVWDSAKKARISMPPGGPTPGRHRSVGKHSLFGLLRVAQPRISAAQEGMADCRGNWCATWASRVFECMVAVGKSLSLSLSRMCSVEKTANI
jgi:hypothetical protein